MTEAPPATGVGRSTAVMAAGTVVSRVLGFVRSSVLAWALGLNIVGSAYLVANTVPTVVYALLAGGAVNAVFVPQLVRALRSGLDRGRAYTDRLLTVVGLALAVVTVLVTVAAPVLARLYAGVNWSPADLALTTALALWCLPQVFLLGAYAVLGQVLNAAGVFGPMMWAPIANNVVVIATGALLAWTGSVDRGGGAAAAASLSAGEIALLGAGTTLGVLAQAAVLLPVLRRAGFRYRPRLDLRGVGLGRAGRLAGWSLLFVAANQVAFWAITKVANTAGRAAPGDAAGMPTYANAYLILLLPHGVIVVSLATAMLPRMSAAAGRGELRRVGEDLSGALRTAMFLLVPAVAAMIVLAPSISRVAFPGNDPAQTRFIGLALLAFAPGLLAFSAHFLVNRAFHALEDTRTPFLVQCLLVAVTIVLAVVAAVALDARWVVVGLAAAHTVTYTVGVVVSAHLIRRRVDRDAAATVLRALGRAVVAVALPAALAATAARLSARLLDGPAADLAAVFGGGVVLGAGYLVAARLLAVPEATNLLTRLRVLRPLRRRRRGAGTRAPDSKGIEANDQ